MPRLGITFEDVEATADKILAMGENPTIEKIRRELGTGSNSTITKYLHEWRTNRLVMSADKPIVPPDPVHAAVNQVWEKIRQESEEEIKNYREKTDAEIELAQKERNDAISDRDQLQQALDACQKRLNQILADKELLGLDLKLLQQEHLILKEKNQSLESQHNLYKQESNNQIILLQSINKKETENHQSTISLLKEEHSNILNKLVETHENYRQQHIVEMDAYKVENQKLEKSIEQFLSDNNSIKIELEKTKATLKVITHEKDVIKNELHEKNKIIESNDVFAQNLQAILNKVEHLKTSESKNEIMSVISNLNKTVDSQQIALTSILNILEKSRENTEAK